MVNENITTVSLSPTRSLAKMIAGQLAVVAIPVFGWLTSGYEIAPDIGRLSFGQKFIIGLYAVAFVLAVIYAAAATFRCFHGFMENTASRFNIKA